MDLFQYKSHDSKKDNEKKELLLKLDENYNEINELTKKLEKYEKRLEVAKNVINVTDVKISFWYNKYKGLKVLEKNDYIRFSDKIKTKVNKTKIDTRNMTLALKANSVKPSEMIRIIWGKRSSFPDELKPFYMYFTKERNYGFYYTEIYPWFSNIAQELLRLGNYEFNIIYVPSKFTKYDKPKYKKYAPTYKE